MASVVALLAAVAMVGFRHARMRSAETAAVVALQAINQAQFAYMQTCGRQRYAPTLQELGTPVPGHETGFISPDLATADPLQKSGYVIRLTGTEATVGEQTCSGVVGVETYALTADPLSPGVTGRSHYGTNTDRVIYTDVATFVEEMPESGPPGRGAEIR